MAPAITVARVRLPTTAGAICNSSWSETPFQRSSSIPWCLDGINREDEALIGEKRGPVSPKANELWPRPSPAAWDFPWQASEQHTLVLGDFPWQASERHTLVLGRHQPGRMRR
eukprot:Skav220218  [mRNA]  locus=scaffold1600:157029:157367:+ [translate_table: standard]